MARLPIVCSLALVLLVPGCAHRRPPTAEEIRQLALAQRGLPPDHAGEIPPADRFIGTRHEPAADPRDDRAGSNVRVNQDASGYDQNETVITASPVNPQFLLGGANDYRTGSVKCGWYASRDGGRTWNDGVFAEPTYPLQGDPTVAFCNDGSAVYVCLSFTGAYQPHGLFAYRTTDGGQSWSGPFTILNRSTGFPFADKEWVGCDTTAGPFRNRVYTTWSDLGLSSRILLRYSANGGQTWSGSVTVSNAGSVQGSVIAVGPDGAVNVAWDNGGTIGFDRSTDGGQTFGADRYPATQVDIPGDPVFRRNSFPAMDADRSAGPHSGSLYIAWSDARHGDPDILLVRSEDDGQTWSAPIRINDDALGNGLDQFFPWVAVDPRGRVVVTWFDRRRDPANRTYEIWGAISRDGGRTFDTNALVSDAASNGNLNDFIGDYSGLAATGDSLHALWTDLRAGTGESDAYTDRFPNTFRYDEVDGAAWTDRDTLSFEAQDARFGQDLDYDVAGGLLSELRADAGFARAACVAAAWVAPPFVDTRVPPTEDAYWYLLRARGPDGVGSYGDGSPARPNVRDPLDEALSPCP